MLPKIYLPLCTMYYYASVYNTYMTVIVTAKAPKIKDNTPPPSIPSYYKGRWFIFGILRPFDMKTPHLSAHKRTDFPWFFNKILSSFDANRVFEKDPHHQSMEIAWAIGQWFYLICIALNKKSALLKCYVFFLYVWLADRGIKFSQSKIFGN